MIGAVAASLASAGLLLAGRPQAIATAPDQQSASPLTRIEGEAVAPIQVHEAALATLCNGTELAFSPTAKYLISRDVRSSPAWLPPVSDHLYIYDKECLLSQPDAGCGREVLSLDAGRMVGWSDPDTPVFIVGGSQLYRLSLGRGARSSGQPSLETRVDPFVGNALFNLRPLPSRHGKAWLPNWRRCERQPWPWWTQTDEL